MFSKWMKKVLAVMFLGLFLSSGFHAKVVHAEVISSLDTVQESFFPTSETTTEADSSYENFFDTTTQQPSISVDTPADSGHSSSDTNNSQNVADSNASTVIPDTPVQNVETVETSNSNNTTTTNNYYYYTTTSTTSTTATPATSTAAPEKSEQITLNGTTTSTDSQEKVVSLKKPQIATVVSKKRAAIVALKSAVTGADGYQVQLCQSKNFKNKVTQLRTVLTTKTVKTNASGVFHVRVRAYKIINGKTVYSAWSPVKTVKIK